MTDKTEQEQDIFTKDSFTNFQAKLGIGANNQMSGSSYSFNPITRIRLTLEFMYRGSWICAAAVDMPAEDMTRTGITITGLDPNDTDDVQQSFSEMGIWASLCEAIKWGRLFGGSLAYLMIDGQDPSTPLNLDSIAEGQFKGLMILDRWQVSPSISEVVNDLGPDFGLPVYYDITADRVLSNTWTRVHHSRMIRFIGHDLPFQQRISEMGWGESVLERINDRLVAYDSASTGAAQMLYKAHLRTLKVDNLRGIIAQGGPAMEGLTAQIQNMRLTQSNEGITLLDKDDEYDAQVYTFSGLHDMLTAFIEQLSGALQIPLTRLLGQSPGGLSSTGDSDITTYYDNIQKQQEVRLRSAMTKILDLTCRSTLGYALPGGVRFKFNPLYTMDEPERAEVAVKTTGAIVSAFQAGIIDKRTALQELRHSSDITGVFSNIQDQDVDDAESEFAGMTPKEPDINMEQTKPDDIKEETGVSR